MFYFISFYFSVVILLYNLKNSLVVFFLYNDLRHTHKQEMELPTCVCTYFLWLFLTKSSLWTEVCFGPIIFLLIIIFFTNFFSYISFFLYFHWPGDRRTQNLCTLTQFLDRDILNTEHAGVMVPNRPECPSMLRMGKCGRGHNGFLQILIKLILSNDIFFQMTLVSSTPHLYLIKIKAILPSYYHT